MYICAQYDVHLGTKQGMEKLVAQHLSGSIILPLNSCVIPVNWWTRTMSLPYKLPPTQDKYRISLNPSQGLYFLRNTLNRPLNGAGLYLGPASI